MTTYGYSRPVAAEMAHLLSLAVASLGLTLPATLQEDFDGTDVHYVLGDLRVQARARFDRGSWYHGIDVTFRTTEPGMIARRTYADLMLFAWFEKGLAELGYLIDIYTLDHAMELGQIEPFDRRTPQDNGDGTEFLRVSTGDLHTARALLGNGTRYAWTPLPPTARFRQRLSAAGGRPATQRLDWSSGSQA